MNRSHFPELLAIVLGITVSAATATEIMPAYKLVEEWVKQVHETEAAFGKGTIDYARIAEADATMTQAKVVDLFKSIDPAEMEMAKRTDESLVVELRVPRITFQFEKRGSNVPDGPPWSYVLVGIEDHRKDNAFRLPAVAEEVKRQPEKLTLTQAWIADAGEPKQYVFVINGVVAYKTVDGLKNYLKDLPKDSTLTWGPGCCRIGGEPLLSSEEEMKKFKEFCESLGIQFILVPSG